MKMNLRLATVSFAILAIASFTSCTKKETAEPAKEVAPVTASTPAAKDASAPAGQTVAQASPAGELKIEEVSAGKGTEAVAGKKVTVHYTGKLTDGKQFDSSIGKEPFTFTLGAGEVISGWDKGVAGMKVGGKRKLTIPPEMAYGTTGAGSIIPPNATLVFDVELLKVQ